MKLIYLNVFDAIFAFFTSFVQTQRIIKNTNRFNTRNTLFLIFLAIFAAFTSIFQSKIIIKKVTSNIRKTV